MEPGGRWITAEDAAILDEAKHVIQLFQVCRQRWDREDAIRQLPAVHESTQHQANLRKASGPGYVYLVRSGGYYKIGYSSEIPIQFKVLREQLPWPAEIVHTIAPDNMLACETAWHTRFAAQRMNSEWFQLDEAQVQEFCRTDAVSLA